MRQQTAAPGKPLPVAPGVAPQPVPLQQAQSKDAGQLPLPAALQQAMPQLRSESALLVQDVITALRAPAT